MKKYLKTSFVIITLIFLSACIGGRSQPSNFYLISSISNLDLDGLEINNKNKKDLLIGINLMYISEYLDRQEIVTIKDDNLGVNLAQFDRWAEPLSDSIQRSITSNISYYMNDYMVKQVNLFTSKYDYVVSIYIDRFDGKFNDKAYIKSSYTITDKTGKIVLDKDFVAHKELGNTYNELVEKQNELVLDLSNDIVESLEGLIE